MVLPSILLEDLSIIKFNVVSTTLQYAFGNTKAVQGELGGVALRIVVREFNDGTFIPVVETWKSRSAVASSHDAMFTHQEEASHHCPV